MTSKASDFQTYGNRQPITNDTPKGKKNMAQTPQRNTQKTTAPQSAKAPETTPATNGNGADPEKAKSAKLPRIKLESPTVPGFWCRMYKHVADKYGLPLGPDGQKLQISTSRGGGGVALSAEEKAKRAAEKAAEKARVEALSPEQRAEYETAKRKESEAKRAAKKQEQRAKLVASIVAGLSPEARKEVEAKLLAK